MPKAEYSLPPVIIAIGQILFLSFQVSKTNTMIFQSPPSNLSNQMPPPLPCSLTPYIFVQMFVIIIYAHNYLYVYISSLNC